jgi:hypothetical protein
MQQGKFGFAALSLSVTVRVLYGCFAQEGSTLCARTLLLQGGAATLLLAASAVLVTAVEQASGLLIRTDGAARAVQTAFFLWFAVELGYTIVQAHTICRQEFLSSALLGVLPLLVLLLWNTQPAAYDRAARMLWWLLFLGALIAAVGLLGRMDWKNLAFQTESSARTVPNVWLFPEYFALPLLTDRGQCKKAVALPIWAFILQAGFALGAEMIFGAAGTGYSGFEILRVWSVGVFSRVDALLLMLWLMAALYRIGFLLAVLQVLGQRILGIQVKQKEGNAWEIK